MIIYCKNCGREKRVRVSDVKRGWGLFCSKSCKAKAQEKRTGQYRKYVYKNNGNKEMYPSMAPIDMGQS